MVSDNFREKGEPFIPELSRIKPEISLAEEGKTMDSGKFSEAIVRIPGEWAFNGKCFQKNQCVAEEFRQMFWSVRRMFFQKF